MGSALRRSILKGLIGISPLMRIIEKFGYSPLRMEEFALHNGIYNNLIRKSSLVIASSVGPRHTQLIYTQVESENWHFVTLKDDRYRASVTIGSPEEPTIGLLAFSHFAKNRCGGMG